MAATTQEMLIVIKVIDIFTRPLKRVQQNLEAISDTVGAFSKKMMPLLGVGLNLMFTGMALERFFGGALRSIFNTYTQIIDVNDRFFQKTQHLRAAWEFVKFALLDAIGQDEGFIALIDFVIQLVNMVGQFLSKHPALARFIVAFMFFAYVLGIILIPLGMIILFFTSFGSATFLVLGLALAFVLIASTVAILWTKLRNFWADIKDVIKDLILGWQEFAYEIGLAFFDIFATIKDSFLGLLSWLGLRETFEVNYKKYTGVEFRDLEKRAAERALIVGDIERIQGSRAAIGTAAAERLTKEEEQLTTLQKIEKQITDLLAVQEDSKGMQEEQLDIEKSLGDIASKTGYSPLAVTGF